MRLFAFASSILSSGEIPERSPQSIWSCRIQLWIAAVVTPSSTTAVVMCLPTRRSATALLRNSTGKGRGMGEASQQKPDPQAVARDQTMGQVKVIARPSAVPSDRIEPGEADSDSAEPPVDEARQ